MQVNFMSGAAAQVKSMSGAKDDTRFPLFDPEDGGDKPAVLSSLGKEAPRGLHRCIHGWWWEEANGGLPRIRHVDHFRPEPRTTSQTAVWSKKASGVSRFMIPRMKVPSLAADGHWSVVPYLGWTRPGMVSWRASPAFGT